MQANDLSFDCLIIGAGPAGLSCAIALAKQQRSSINIGIIEKGAEVGAHIISGNILETRALDELIPDWKQRNPPIHTAVQKDRFYWLTKSRAWRLPTPPQMYNNGNYIMSLSQFCRWLAKEAEALGVTIIAGYAAQQTLIEKNQVVGVITNDVGRNKDGSPGENFQPGVRIYAAQTILAEGCRGSITEEVIKQFSLRKHCQMQTYALGVKEVWRCPKEVYDDGLAIHSIGWPLQANTYGGGFIYHYEQEKIALGLVIGLDYKNPYLDAHAELQRFKQHPRFQAMFAQSTCIAYAARTLNEGGYQAIGQLSFPGGMIIGCAAGFLNIAKLKGTHTAMASGILAAKALSKWLKQPQTQRPPRISSYDQSLKKSWIMHELWKVRNIRAGFYHGLGYGLLNAAFETLTQGYSPWTKKLHTDHDQLLPASPSSIINYPKPDGKISFSKLDSVRLSATNHTENQPCHLILANPKLALECNYPIYAGPESRYCPANVYEYIEVDGEKKFQINAQNCIHCKACSIKDPNLNIKWTPPQGGEGPLYTET